jgi:hypothetical protein
MNIKALLVIPDPAHSLPHLHSSCHLGDLNEDGASEFFQVLKHLKKLKNLNLRYAFVISATHELGIIGLAGVPKH